MGKVEKSGNSESSTASTCPAAPRAGLVTVHLERRQVFTQPHQKLTHRITCGRLRSHPNDVAAGCKALSWEVQDCKNAFAFKSDSINLNTHSENPRPPASHPASSLNLTANPEYVALAEWGERNFRPTPSLHTLRGLVRKDRIDPPAIKIGKAYYVTPNARPVDPNRRETLVARLRRS